MTGVFAHGQIVGESYIWGDTVSKAERFSKGQYLLMDSNVLSDSINNTIKNGQKLRGLIDSCFMNPSYPNGRTTLSVPPGMNTRNYPSLDLLAEPVYKVSCYGSSNSFDDLIDNVIDLDKHCKVAVVVFQGRYSDANPTNLGYE